MKEGAYEGLNEIRVIAVIVVQQADIIRTCFLDADVRCPAATDMLAGRIVMNVHIPEQRVDHIP